MASPVSNLIGRTAFLAALTTAIACATGVAAVPRDGAVIVDSGSTNSTGYKIEVWSDGTASLTLQNRAGVAQSSAKPFAISQVQATQFFADMKAARSGNATGAPCMKSASFGTTTHVSWHGWTSPDLDCPADNALTTALVHDVAAIRTASGVNTMPLHRVLLPSAPRSTVPVSAPSPSPASTER